MKLKIQKGIDTMSYAGPSENIYLRSFASEGHSKLILSLFKANLTFKFVPYLGKDHNGVWAFDSKMFLSTSINYGGASLFWLAAKRILEEGTDQVEVILPCNNNAALILEYKPDENGQMKAFLTIDKDRRKIAFKFSAEEIKITKNGHMEKLIVQSELRAFAFALKGYLLDVSIALRLQNFTKEDFDTLQPPYPMGNGGQY
jgi:hypothetical protein